MERAVRIIIAMLFFDFGLRAAIVLLMAVSIKDLCRETGLSMATVTRALSNDPRLKAETRLKVLDAAQRLGYQPPQEGQSEALHKPRTLGIVFHELVSGFYSLIMTGIDLEAYKHGLQLLITISKPQGPGERSPYDMLEAAQVDGLIVMDGTLDSAKIGKLKRAGCPIVVIQNTFYDSDVSSVAPDDTGGAYKAMKHLLAQEYRKILLVAGSPGVEDTELRMQGCKQALAEYGLSLNDVGVIAGDYMSAEALHAFRNYRKRHELPRAIFAFNDDMALALMKELRQQDVRIPEDVAIVGFDGIDASDLMGLTTIRVPMIEVGREAVRLVAERIDDPKASPRHLIKETTLVVRESCGAIQRQT